MTLEKYLDSRIAKYEKTKPGQDSADFLADVCVLQELRVIRQLLKDGVLDDVGNVL